jgi:hypothetical protein
MADVKGMVQFDGATYRIVKVERGKYDVIRILDEVRIGSFETVPKLRVHPVSVAEKLLLGISMTALKQAKISWQKMQGPRAPKAPSSSKMPSSRPARTSGSSIRLRAAKPT